MQNFYTTLTIFLLDLWIQEGFSRAIAIPGSVTETEVTHFEFIQRLGNPCGVIRLEEAGQTPEPLSNYYVDTANNTQFYESMLIAVDSALTTLNTLQKSDPDLPECPGTYLETLPPTPPLTNLNDNQLFREIYKSGLFLAAHLHIMGLDRQLTVVGINDVSDDNIDEQDGLPYWRYLRCGNESGSFMLRITEMALQMENILCTIVSSASAEQRATFRSPFNKLVKTTFFRYHSSCTTLQTRDCLVIQETKKSLKTMADKFNFLLKTSNHSESQVESGGNAI